MAELAIAEGGQSVPRHGVSLREAFRVWLRVALLSFGGPAGQIAVMHRILVEEKRWISESAVPACAQLLHAVAGPRGAAARDLYRLADAPHAGRDHGRRPLRRSRHHRHHGAQLRLCRLRQRAGDRRAVLRTQGRGARDRAGGGVPHRQALAEEQRDARARGGRLCRHLLFRHSVSRSSFSARR